MTQTQNTSSVPHPSISFLRKTFVHLGILPLLLVLALLFFGLQEPRFYSGLNAFNVVRQTTFLMIVALGQMVVVLTAGLDMSVGAVVSFAGIVAAIVLKAMFLLMPDAFVFCVFVGIMAGLAAGALIGALNGAGVALLGVSPFMMTLGTTTSLVGVSLMLTNGAPLTGVPEGYMALLGHGRWFGLAPSIVIAAVLLLLTFLLLNRTTTGRYFYAIGSNLRAAQLSGINTRFHLVLAYVVSALMASVVGLLFIARTGTADAVGGQSLTLQSIAACVIGGVSLFGGIGKVRDVFLGAFFITILTNGMNLIRVESYVQSIVLGIVLILSLVADQFRIKLLK